MNTKLLKSLLAFGVILGLSACSDVSTTPGQSYNLPDDFTVDAYLEANPDVGYMQIADTISKVNKVFENDLAASVKQEILSTIDLDPANAAATLSAQFPKYASRFNTMITTDGVDEASLNVVVNGVRSDSITVIKTTSLAAILADPDPWIEIYLTYLSGNPEIVEKDNADAFVNPLLANAALTWLATFNIYDPTLDEADFMEDFEQDLSLMEPHYDHVGRVEGRAYRLCTSSDAMDEARSSADGVDHTQNFYCKATDGTLYIVE
jgi:hypothetical protein